MRVGRVSIVSIVLKVSIVWKVSKVLKVSKGTGRLLNTYPPSSRAF